VIFDTESSALSEEEKRIARRFAAKAVRGKEEAKETASQLYALLRTLPTSISRLTVATSGDASR
jgi:hypothetical protein